MIQRIITQAIEKDFFKQKIIVVLGPRQVGKTTLLKQVVGDCDSVLMFNCDNLDERTALENKTTTELLHLFGNHKIVLIDEAQRVKNIGLTLKIAADTIHDVQVIATGSSSLEIGHEINEPATGRLREYKLFPFSLQELAGSSSAQAEHRLLEYRMVYGMYPEVVTHPDDAKRILKTLTNSYLYKDLLAYKGIRKPDVLQKLVQALALQLGSEVSYNELSRLVGIDKETVENYVDLLEKCFIVFRLGSFSRNLRKEIRKGKKVYFYDNGIRNAILSNFAPLSLRQDVGALWENFMVSERLKHNAYRGSYAHSYFWRTQDQQEVDLVEEEDGALTAYEFKWNSRLKKIKQPTAFAESYPQAQWQVVTPENYRNFIDCSG
ncbi:MAG: ATP-binding protein [Prevotellaceae bacterium]|jgi:predicted AAA+ superfamily ATPase|nr:ATP-binding protein [Prevotellaceae bacterium]